MTYNKDMTGDGMLGAIYYTRGHVKVRRSLFSKVLAFILTIKLLFILFLVLGSILHVNVAQNVLNDLIAGIK